MENPFASLLTFNAANLVWERGEIAHTLCFLFWLFKIGTQYFTSLSPVLPIYYSILIFCLVVIFKKALFWVLKKKKHCMLQVYCDGLKNTAVCITHPRFAKHCQNLSLLGPVDKWRRNTFRQALNVKTCFLVCLDIQMPEGKGYLSRTFYTDE